jgi:hypothetical protein
MITTGPEPTARAVTELSKVERLAFARAILSAWDAARARSGHAAFESPRAPLAAAVAAE